MSEYQYYEFLAVDRPLDDRQLDQLRALSTRATITRTSFINEYQWGAFRGDPRVLMTRYFDAFLYLANWGTRQLMIRLPAGLLTPDVAQRYCVGDAVTAWESGDHVIVSLTSEDEDGDWEHGGEGWLASIAPARAELAAGDLRALYLAWLLSAQSELDNNDVEPPVPAGLGALTGPLRSLTEFLRIDRDLLDVAASASRSGAQPLVEISSDVELDRLIDSLPPAEKNALLRRVLRGDAHVHVELRRRLHGEPEIESTTGQRKVGELLSAAADRRRERERLAEQVRVDQRARSQRQAEIARDKRLEALSERQEQAWGQVGLHIDSKRPREYDAAVRILQDLRAVSERQDRSEAFDQRLAELRLRHRRKLSLLQRLDEARLAGRARWPHTADG